MHAERLGSVFRTVLLSLRTLLIWTANLALFYSHISEGVGERWDNHASPIQVFGFVFLLAGTMLYAQGSSSVVRYSEEVIGDVQNLGQAVRQMSTMSSQSLESVWTELAQRPGIPLRGDSPISQALALRIQAPFDVMTLSQPMSSLDAPLVQPDSPVVPGPLLPTTLQPSLPPLGLPPQSPRSGLKVSGFAGQDDTLTVAGSSSTERPSFTDEVNSVVNSGILELAVSTSFRQSILTMPHASSQDPFVIMPSELHSAFLRPSVDGAPSRPGALARIPVILFMCTVRTCCSPTSMVQ